MSHTRFPPRSGVLEIAPYEGGASSLGSGHKNVIKLSSNENPYGASPMAAEAYRAAGDNLALYPDGHAVVLRQTLAERWGLDASKIICGAGSDEVINFLCIAYAGQGDEVMYCEHGFLMYRLYALSVGAVPVAVPEKNRTADVDAMLARLTSRTKLVFLANPNNPTGVCIPQSEVNRLAEGLPDGCLLVLDAAYAEYVDTADYNAGVELVEARDNVVMLRTFSKLYGLAALRVGWGYGPDHVIDVLNRVRGPFNVSAAAQTAAVAALKDVAYHDECIAKNAICKQILSKAFEAAGFSVTPSQGNFIMVDIGTAEKAALMDQHFKNNGILIRRIDGYGLPSCLRVSIGTEDETNAVVMAIKSFESA